MGMNGLKYVKNAELLNLTITKIISLQLTLTIMKTMINTLKLSSVLKANGVQFPNTTAAQSKTVHNHFVVTVKNDKGKFNFDFYDSHQNCMNGVLELDKDALNGALGCAVSDALAGNDTYEEFCSSFGYEPMENIHTASKKIYKSCKKTLDSFKKIGLGVDELSDLSNEMNDNN